MILKIAYCWYLHDTGKGMAGFVPGFQLISGIYFTGRIGYQMYESYQKP
jgi:hypothetical protein